jgi:hypothetical protein
MCHTQLAELVVKCRGDLRNRNYWVSAEALRKKQATSTNPSQRQSAADSLAYWLVDPALSSVRPGVARIAVPADERAAWDTFWADVKLTIAEAKKPVPPPEVAPLPRRTTSPPPLPR